MLAFFTSFSVFMILAHSDSKVLCPSFRVCCSRLGCYIAFSFVFLLLSLVSVLALCSRVFYSFSILLVFASPVYFNPRIFSLFYFHICVLVSISFIFFSTFPNSFLSFIRFLILSVLLLSSCSRAASLVFLSYNTFSSQSSCIPVFTLFLILCRNRFFFLLFVSFSFSILMLLYIFPVSVCDTYSPLCL